jgi:cyclic lactone autoinducer peptide
MTKLATLSRNVNLALLTGIGALATAFAMMSTASCSVYWFYQPQMPASLIKED